MPAGYASVKRSWIAFFFFSSRRRHTRSTRDWSSDVCSSDLVLVGEAGELRLDGFTYENLDDPGTAAQRVAWLRRDPAAYLPQPFEQLAAVYRGKIGRASCRERV